jgi:O-antigen/teichoic acid export membrane protein
VSEIATEAEALAETAMRTARSQVAAHAGITFAGLMTANVLGYVFYALVSRALGVESYGTFSSLIAIVLIVSSPAAIAQMVVAKLASDLAFDADRLAGLVRLVDRVALAVALAAGAVLIVASVPLATFLHLADPQLVVLAGFSLCGAIALPFLRGVLQGTSAFRAFALSTVAENFAKAMFAPVLGVVAGLRGAIGGMALAYALAAAYTFFAGLPHRRGKAVPLPLREIVRTSAAVALAVFCVNVLLLYDVVLAKRYLDAHTVGLYGAAALASRALYAVIAFVPTVLLPQAAGRSARGERTRGLFFQAFGVALALGITAIGFYALFPRLVVVAIAGRSFAGAAPYLLPYVYAMAAISLANVVATYNIARGRMGFVVPLACVALGEIASVVVRHRTPADLLQTIVVGHTLALFATAASLGGASRGPADAGPRSRKR